MTKVHSASSKVWRVFKSQAFRSVMDFIAVVALILGIYAIYIESANAREQAQHLRVTICGVAETYLAADPGVPKATKGQALTKALNDARSPQGANCTADLHDGR